MTNAHVSQTQTATTTNATNGRALEADFERHMPRTGLIQQWAYRVHTELQQTPYETIVLHRLQTWLINKVAERHPNRKFGAISWFINLSLPQEGCYQYQEALKEWADEAYRIIFYSSACDDAMTQEQLLQQLKADLLLHGVNKRAMEIWLTQKQMPRQPKRPEGPRQPIRTTIPPQQREPKMRSTPMPQHHKKACLLYTSRCV